MRPRLREIVLAPSKILAWRRRSSQEAISPKAVTRGASSRPSPTIPPGVRFRASDEARSDRRQASIPGVAEPRLEHLLVDVNGTLTNRGELLDGVEARLGRLLRGEPGFEQAVRAVRPAGRGAARA